MNVSKAFATNSGFARLIRHERFNVFRDNFAEGMEREGASVAVYYRGRQVVHMWGGWADRSANRPWTLSTRSHYFSATKVC